MNYKLTVFLLVILSSCGSHRPVATVPVETVVRDTLRRSAMRYDSVFIYNNVYTDRSRDTLFIRETTAEHRYRILRDTVRIVRRDSVPYEVRVPVTVATPRRDGHAARLLSVCIAVAVVAIFIKFRSHTAGT